jgi:hypothetical protein
MMLTQLNPPLPLLTPKGKAWAHLVIDYGPEADLLWVCFQDEDGACWTWSNRDVRIQPNATLRRVIPPL